MVNLCTIKLPKSLDWVTVLSTGTVIMATSAAGLIPLSPIFLSPKSKLLVGWKIYNDTGQPQELAMAIHNGSTKAVRARVPSSTR